MELMATRPGAGTQVAAAGHLDAPAQTQAESQQVKKRHHHGGEDVAQAEELLFELDHFPQENGYQFIFRSAPR